ncbi:MAG: hypothetical protein H7175_13195, partial [Burkholderiales bacterium]|nr:hypothetical protein [Anaerolineae bacterium]
MTIRRFKISQVLLLALVIALLSGIFITQAQDGESVTLDPTDPALVTYYIHDGDVTVER